MKQGAISIGELPVTRYGPIWVGVTDRGLAAVIFDADEPTARASLHRSGYDPVRVDPTRTAEALSQIDEYLQGKRRKFDLPIDWAALTPFQEQVLRATIAIPYGQVTTYHAIARQLDKPGAARAVGRAEATNPIPLVIPCHRVIGSDGGLHGYGGPGGISMKAGLLEMEGK